MNTITPATTSQEIDDGTPPAYGEDGLPTCCLYFLVCAATSGPLVGLVKVGIADYFPMRYRQHLATWGEFDLSQSVLLRVRSRREAQQLEIALRYHFGDPLAESLAKAAGKTLTSQEFIAMGIWRRHPGRRDDGYTEFYALDCLARMLAYVEDWRLASGERKAGTRLQRGISLPEHRTRVRSADPSPTRIQSRESRECRHFGGCQAAERMRRASERLMSDAFGAAMAYTEFVVHVDLRPWRAARAASDPALGREGLMRIYFRPLEFVPYEGYPHLEPWLQTQTELRKSFASHAALVNSLHLNNSEWRGIGRIQYEKIYRVRPNDAYSTRHLPFPIHTELVCARLGTIYSSPFDPAFGLFELLEEAVEEQQVLSQTEFL